MTRIGWAFLAIAVLTFAAFLSMTTFGTKEVRPSSSERTHSAADPTGLLIVPVAGVDRSAIRDSWGDPRGGGIRGHHGTDIMAASGTPVIAAASGRIEKLFQSRLGGTTLYVRSPHGGWIYYYAHLSAYAAGVHEGQAVKAGTPIGYVGDTGDAGAGNYHLHFGLQRMRTGNRWWQGEDVNPYPLLAGTAARR